MAIKEPYGDFDKYFKEKYINEERYFDNQRKN